MDNIQEIVSRLHSAQLKVTPQRIAVMQALMTSHSHPTAEEIFKQVSQNLPGLSPTTVYNVLDVFVRKGLIKRVKTEHGVMRYDAVTDTHHHLYCESSDRMEDFQDPELDQLLAEYFSKKKIQGFRLKDVKLQIVGEFEK
jgi:Fur family transcriptional regulator, peroxide stress response regulator